MLITVLGIPIPLRRVAEKSINGKHWRFDPQAKEKIEFQKKIRNEVITEGTITYLLSKESYDITLLFGMPYPLSKRRKVMPDLCDIPHVTKPDLDNLIKFVLDCGNELLWSDDKKITRISAHKLYVEEPKTIINIH